MPVPLATLGRAAFTHLVSAYSERSSGGRGEGTFGYLVVLKIRESAVNVKRAIAFSTLCGCVRL